MSRPDYSILFSAPIAATSAAGQRGQVLLPSSDASDGGRYVISTSTNRGTRRSTGVALSNFTAGGSVALQQAGEIDADISGLAAGDASWVRVSDAGYLERVAVPSHSDDVVGRAETDGRVRLMFGVLRANYVPQSWYNVLDYGADPTGVADSAAAINAAIHATGAGGTYPGSRGAVVYIPAGIYRLASSVIVDRVVVLQGAVGSGQRASTILKADAGVTAVIVSNGPQVITGAIAGPGDGTALYATIRDFAVFGPGNNLGVPAAGTEAHGVKLLVSCELRNIFATGFTGNGFNHVATSAAGLEGNANTCYVVHCWAEYNRGHGFYIEGADVNASTYIQCSATDNLGVGIYDKSFLGNTHIGHHTRDNGTRNYKSEGGTNATCWIGCYSEEGGTSEFDYPAVVIGGLHGSPNVGTASAPSLFQNWHGKSFATDFGTEWTANTDVYIRSTRMVAPAATFRLYPVWFLCTTTGTTGSSEPAWATATAIGQTLTDGTAVWTCMGSALVEATAGASAKDEAVAFSFTSADDFDSYKLQYVNQRWTLRWASQVYRAFTLGGIHAFPGAGHISFPNGVHLGATDSRSDDGRRHTTASAAPTTGYWRRGDVVWNSAPSSGGAPGWVCVTSGQSDAAHWAASTSYRVGDVVAPVASNGFVYQCVMSYSNASVVTGSSGAVEPTWTTSEGDQFADGGLIWECVGVSTGAVFKAMANLA